MKRRTIPRVPERWQGVLAELREVEALRAEVGVLITQTWKEARALVAARRARGQSAKGAR